MRTLLPFATLIAVGFAIPTTDGWAEFKARFGKVYTDPQEDLTRKEIFLENKACVDRHNALFAAGQVTYKKAVNHLSDMTQEEIRANAKGFIPSPAGVEGIEFYEPSGDPVPDEFDWRTKGAVTPVKDQGTCGACYVFSATGALEGQYAIKKNQNVSLSEQQEVDCCPAPHCNKCHGGDPAFVLKHIAKEGGIESESDYPYVDRNSTCKFKRSEVVATDTGVKRIAPGDEDALKQAVAEIGPISVGLVATANLQAYHSGIFVDPSCADGNMDHAALVVGYGTEGGQDYWLVKNSWGSNWGENGYFRMARNSNNMCQIANYANYPLV